MSGVKGISGRARTPEERQAKIAAGRAGGLAKAARGRPVDPPATGSPPPPFKFWSDYKDSLECALRLRKIEAADIEIEGLRTKLDQDRGKVRTLEAIRARDSRLSAIISDQSRSVIDLVAKLVPPHQITLAQEWAEEWASAYLAEVATALDSWK